MAGDLDQDRSFLSEVYLLTPESIQDNMGSVMGLQTLITEIARALVDKADAVEVRSIEENGSVVFRLSVAPEDIGKVIGKQGRTARSLRTILGAASMKSHARVTLDIVEDNSSSS